MTVIEWKLTFKQGSLRERMDQLRRLLHFGLVSSLTILCVVGHPWFVPTKCP